MAQELLKDRRVSVLDVSRLLGKTKASVLKWVKEDPNSPFKNCPTENGGTRLEASLPETVRWLIKRSEDKANPGTIPDKNKRNMELVEQNLWMIASAGYGSAAVNANNMLKEILEERQLGALKEITVRFQVLDTDEEGYPTEIDETVESVHNKTKKVTKKKKAKKKATKKK